MKKVVLIIVGTDFQGNKFRLRETFFADARWLAFAMSPQKAYKKLLRPHGMGYYLKSGILQLFMDDVRMMKIKAFCEDLLDERYVSIMKKGDPDVQEEIMKQTIRALQHAAERQIQELQMKQLQEKLGMPYEIPKEDLC